MINFELYRAFIIVADEQNITKASEKLHISQPALTKQIHILEESLNVKLFERSKVGVSLTSKGTELYSKIQESIHILNRVENEFVNRYEIKYGTRNQIFNNLFSDKIIKFINENPNIKLYSDVDLIPNMLKKLSNYELDVVFSRKISNFEEFKNIKFITLGELRDVLITKKNSKYANRIYTKDDLKNEIIYTKDINSRSTINLINTLNLLDTDVLKKIVPFGNANSLIKLIQENENIGLMVKEYIKNELDEGKLEIIKTDFEINPAEFGIYYNKNNKTEQTNKLIEYLKESFKSIY